MKNKVRLGENLVKISHLEIRDLSIGRNAKDLKLSGHPVVHILQCTAMLRSTKKTQKGLFFNQNAAMRQNSKSRGH